MSWEYKGNAIQSLEDMPEDVFGFIYEVTHKSTGKKYLGRKQLIYTRKRKMGKRESKKLKEEKKAAGKDNWWTIPKYKYVKKESDWKEYIGSNDTMLELLEEGSLDDFKREILEFAYDKKHLNYLETMYLFKNDVLINENYTNGNILGKYYPKDILPYING